LLTGRTLEYRLEDEDNGPATGGGELVKGAEDLDGSRRASDWLRFGISPGIRLHRVAPMDCAVSWTVQQQSFVW
jgi:hypothetical protein